MSRNRLFIIFNLYVAFLCILFFPPLLRFVNRPLSSSLSDFFLFIFIFSVFLYALLVLRRYSLINWMARENRTKSRVVKKKFWDGRLRFAIFHHIFYIMLIVDHILGYSLSAIWLPSGDSISRSSLLPHNTAQQRFVVIVHEILLHSSPSEECQKVIKMCSRVEWNLRYDGI